MFSLKQINREIYYKETDVFSFGLSNIVLAIGTRQLTSVVSFLQVMVGLGSPNAIHFNVT